MKKTFVLPLQPPARASNGSTKVFFIIFTPLFQRTDVLLHVGAVAGILGRERQIPVEGLARPNLVTGLHVMHPQALVGRGEIGSELLGRLKRLQRLLLVVLLVATDIGFAQIVITGGRE